MAMQSHQGLIRLFPCWDKKLNAKFKNLRADGAFLVSSEIQNGKVGTTVIRSEIGGTAHILMPYSGLEVTYRGTTKHYPGNRLDLETEPNEIITIA
ncbi:MAG TPA: hypothetical protein DDY98_02700 [Ruminococcaceae bacterium]|nr:hypothetical protein [Oscillospiraceae bacterium]